ncbi:MAG: transcription termination factor NusA, partial [Chloroflexi bacterium]|nr:transcription termination factor NusA [Chloroflexota bacterium]
MKNEFVTAIAQLSAEKNLNADTVFEAVEAAMASAFKKDELQYAEIEVKIDRDSGDIHAWRLFNVIDDDEIEDDEIEVSPERAAEMGHAGAAIGDVVREVLEENPNAGRIAAQTAKQVVLQRLREAERESVFEDFTGKEGELVSGTVLRVEGGRRQVILDLGRTEAVLPAAEQVRPEHYRVGQRLRVYVKEVYKASKGPQVVVSRANPALIKRLFELEVPEISRGAVEVMGIAREPGYRAKVAVISRQHGIDPIGATVGVRGSRIQNLVNELGGERIDLIRWDPNEAAFVANALSPAEVVSIKLDEDTHTAFVAVPDKQLSLAIGKEGQNARLAAKLTGWRIDIRAESALIKAGEDMYQPPEPNTEAIPLRDQPGLAAATTLELPDEVAPSISAYGRPGLPGERRTVVAPTPAPVAEPVPHEVRLTPEL